MMFEIAVILIVVASALWMFIGFGLLHKAGYRLRLRLIKTRYIKHDNKLKDARKFVNGMKKVK